MTIPEQVLGKMWSNDQFSQWLGLKITEITEGGCRLHFTVRAEMLNGFGTIQGGVLFAAADSAFAFACNSHGRLSVALECAISFTKPAKLGDVLTVIAEEQHLSNKTGVYAVKIWNETGEIVAIFKGTSYRTSQLVLEK
jgi:acyl-CoA thioesterase